MKILYCNKYNFSFSGTEVYLFDLMELARAQGHQAALFSMADARGASTPYDSFFVPLVDFKATGKSVLEKTKLAGRAIYSPEARRRLRLMIAEFRPDVAHVRNIYHHLTPSILWELKAQRVPVLYHLNDFKLVCPSYNLVSRGHACERCQGGKFRHMLSEGCYEGPRTSAIVLAAEAYAQKWMRTYQRCVDLFLAPSQFVKERLEANGWDAEKIDVLPHFQKLPAGPAAKVTPDAPILYFGRLSPEKGVHDLLRAMASLPGVRLSVAGEGPQRGELEEAARSLDLHNVEFLGHLQGEALDSTIAAARFTVLPSRAYETLGKSILESYAHGRAVVASDLGSRRELVHDGQTGLLFPPGDVAGLTRAISQLVDHPQRTAAMGAAGRELVREQYSPDEHYQALSQVYEQLLHSRRPVRKKLVSTASPRLRVAFIGGRGVVSKYSGIETYYEEAGEQLSRMGYDVTVYCRSYFTPRLKQYRGMRLVRLPTIRSKHLETVVHTLLSTVHTLFQGYDIVHFHALGPALFSFLPRLLRKKTVVTVQGLDWRRKKWGWLAAAVLRLGEQAAVRLPNTTMVVSRTLQDHYRTRYGVETTYVPNGTTLMERRKVSRVSPFGFAPERYILFLGRFTPEKNCHLLIEAYEKLETSVKLVLAGGASYSQAYAEQLRTHASPRIHLLDWVSGEQRDQLLRNALLLVLPSDLEGLSLVLLEAMGAGVCVLASDIPENCEVVADAGFTFRQGDADDLAQMMRLLIASPAVRRAAAERARARARDHYLWSQVVRQIDSAYRELAGPRIAAPAMPPQKLPATPEAKRNRHAA